MSSISYNVWEWEKRGRRNIKPWGVTNILEKPNYIKKKNNKTVIWEPCAITVYIYKHRCICNLHTDNWICIYLFYMQNLQIYITFYVYAKLYLNLPNMSIRVRDFWKSNKGSDSILAEKGWKLDNDLIALIIQFPKPARPWKMSSFNIFWPVVAFEMTV